eukprot:6128742-Pyramimonas_sp.AAC.1
MCPRPSLGPLPTRPPVEAAPPQQTNKQTINDYQSVARETKGQPIDCTNYKQTNKQTNKQINLARVYSLSPSAIGARFLR